MPVLFFAIGLLSADFVRFASVQQSDNTMTCHAQDFPHSTSPPLIPGLSSEGIGKDASNGAKRTAG